MFRYCLAFSIRISSKIYSISIFRVFLDFINEEIQTCNQYDVILMDGTMFMHHKRLATLGKQITDPIYNHIPNRPLHVRSLFSFNAPKIIYPSTASITLFPRL